MSIKFEEVINRSDNQDTESLPVVETTKLVFSTPIEELYSAVFCEMLGITKDQVLEILDSAGYKKIPGEYREFSETAAQVNYRIKSDMKDVVEFLSAADKLGLVDSNKVHSIKTKMQYTNKTVPDYYTIAFISGSKISDLGTNNVLANNDKFVIGSDWTGAVNLGESDITIMKLTDTLKLDKSVNFYYCKPEEYTLEDIEWFQSVKLTDGKTLKVSGNVIIKAECPIDAEGTIIIEGVGENATLKLQAMSDMQPCIGCSTFTGLSYGRWSIARSMCKEIHLKNVHVICESKNENFALGEYGTDNIPEIIIEDNASIDAPEIGHKRIMKVGPDYQEGSTKLSNIIVYEIQ